MPSGRHRTTLATQLDVGVWVAGQEVFRDLNHGHFRCGDTQVMQERRGDPFIDQDPAMLRIVVELNDVGMAVGGFHQVGLRSSAHLADEAASDDRHLQEFSGRRANWSTLKIICLMKRKHLVLIRPREVRAKKSRWS